MSDRNIEDTCGGFACSLRFDRRRRSYSARYTQTADGNLIIACGGRRSTSGPLAGLSVAIKDQYPIKGVICTMGSRDAEQVWGPATETCDLVKSLETGGATIVGVTKTTIFCGGAADLSGMYPRIPINPRGDGQDDPGASSTGTAVVVAAYDNLAAIGSNHNGSAHGPGGLNGNHTFIASWAALSMGGALTLSPLLDAPSVHASDPDTLVRLSTHLMSNCPGQMADQYRARYRQSSLRLPTDLVYICPLQGSYYEEVDEQTRTFAQNVASTLGIQFSEMTPQQVFSRTSMPAKDFELLRDMQNENTNHHMAKFLGENLIPQFASTNNGAFPGDVERVLPYLKDSHYSEYQKYTQEILQSRLVFNEIFMSLDGTTQGGTVFVTPYDGTDCSYSVGQEGTSVYLGALSELSMGCRLQTPFTMREFPSDVNPGAFQYLPVSAAFLGGLGADRYLLNMCEDMVENELLPVLESGSVIFPQMFDQSA